MSDSPDVRMVRRARGLGWVASVGAVVAVGATVGLFLVSDPSSGNEDLIWICAPLILLGAGVAMVTGRIAGRAGEASARWAFTVGAVLGAVLGLMLLAAGIGKLLGFE